MVDFNDRMDSLEALITIVTNKYSLDTMKFLESNAAITEIWNQIDDIKERLEIVEDQIKLQREILLSAKEL
jgi:hypothetical protein